MVRGVAPARESRRTSQFAEDARKSMFSARWRSGSRKSALAMTIMREVSAAKRSSFSAPRVTEAAMCSGGAASRITSKVTPALSSSPFFPKSASPQNPSPIWISGVGAIFFTERSSAFSRTSSEEEAPSKTAARPARSFRKGMPSEKFPRVVVVMRSPLFVMMRSRRGVTPLERRKMRRFGGH